MGLEVSDFPLFSSPSCYWKADMMAGTHTATLCHEAEGSFEDQRSNKIKQVRDPDDCEGRPTSLTAYLG